MANDRRPKTDGWVLITGASTGIGYELAKLFAREGYRQVLISRDRQRLEQRAVELHKLGSPEVRIIARDLSDLEAPDEIFAETQRAGLDIDVLVNNAGFGVRGAFAKTSLDSELDMVQLNIVALMHLTKLYLPQMIARRRGRIMQLASTAGFQAGPFMAVYYATKAFVISLSEALHEELRGTGVTVTCVCPGATETEFADRAGMRNTRLFAARVMDAATVARIAYRATLAGKPLVITGTRNWLLAQSLRISPRALIRRFVRKINEPVPARRP